MSSLSAYKWLTFYVLCALQDIQAEALVEIVVAFAEMGYSPGLMFLQLLVRELDARHPANLAVGMASFARLEHHPGALLASAFAQELVRQLRDPQADLVASLEAFCGIPNDNLVIRVRAVPPHCMTRMQVLLPCHVGACLTSLPHAGQGPDVTYVALWCMMHSHRTKWNLWTK